MLQNRIKLSKSTAILKDMSCLKHFKKSIFLFLLKKHQKMLLEVAKFYKSDIE